MHNACNMEMAPAACIQVCLCLCVCVTINFINIYLVSCIQVKAEASWDSTVHECPQLSRGGGACPEQRVYLTLRVAVQLSHPAEMQLVLRKRVCVNVNPGRQGFAQNLLKRMSTRSTIPGCGVTFEVVSNIPGVRRGRLMELDGDGAILATGETGCMSVIGVGITGYRRIRCALHGPDSALINILLEKPITMHSR